MAITTFIPTIWSARLLEALRNSLVYANVMNRNYEGEISQQGDTVKINFLSDITVKKYVKGTDITAERLSTTDLDLVIDQASYFNFLVNDVDKVQAAGDQVNTAMSNAGYQLANDADKYLAGMLAGTNGAIVTGLGSDATPLSIKLAAAGDTEAYDLMVLIKIALDKANVPAAGRWIVVPPEFEGAMLKDPRFVSTGTGQAENRLSNGMVARAAGLDISISNNVPNTSGAKWKVMAGYSDTASYAQQILNTEAYRVEKGFDDGVKGLHVYGSKVVRPNTLAIATVNFA